MKWKGWRCSSIPHLKVILSIMSDISKTISFYGKTVYNCYKNEISTNFTDFSTTCRLPCTFVYTYLISIGAYTYWLIDEYTLEKTERTIKNWQSRDTGNIGYTRHRTKTKHKNTTQHRKLKRWVAWTPPNTWNEPMCLLMIRSSCLL
jgi:hypothetical protein